MAVFAQLPTVGTVVTTAAIDSINPCAIGVLILMMSVLIVARKSKGKILLYGFVYVFSVFLTYLLAGLGLLHALTYIPLVLTEYIALTVGTIVVLAGIIELKDFFWYGKGFSLAIPVRFTKKLHELAEKRTLPAMIVLGIFVAAVELPCTGAPYLAIITILSQNFDATAFLLLVAYNLIFVLPLAVIVGMVALGAKLHEIKKWKHRNRPYMRLFTGLLVIVLGWLLILIANGTVNFG
ncbi:hypothetical protein HY546_01320 [archaeon]|nr:hypothetical protein [archaeon]